MDQSAASTEAAQKPPRKLSRETRRQQLIDATIETIAVRGYARTTLTDVASQAGLSHGLVNFHFQSKEKLLSETLLFLAEEYRDNWTQALADAGPAPAHRLDAMLRADFNPSIYTQAKLSAWCAFWGEAQCRPLYQDHCGANDAAYQAAMEELCVELKAEGGYPYDPIRAARVLRVTTEGVWLDMMTVSTPYDQEEALGTVHACAAALFPKHFGPDGLIV
ncbi:TetR family transcriptional regulator C-terminal domain-containing protein [Frigidibacter sp. RF13]|uniref:TetR family transcriptional regulator C-terminal domain-containing protein n=1 Tax=Frigidibacter sp. RF13 TaxID=2997340 RepID=UPI00227052A4|nr:TetR family transcriptional regulator [Frigidibacter sp. RF13]MCY1128100.1 TetR family transcriptional regulator C-terminal domain-containing protein [Frigidibacter sp. RF13]